LGLTIDEQQVLRGASEMRGFLLDENLPSRLRFSPSLPLFSVLDVGRPASDSEIWNFARQRDLVIVSKDADFSDRIMLSSPPPKVVHLRFGNLRSSEFHVLLARVWPNVEALLSTNKLVNVYRDRLESIG
jgi:predicted nuclease of predicted toxin-antitoxin system